MTFATADGHLVHECPVCHHFTMTEDSGAWACRNCAGSVLVHVQEVVVRRGFRPKRRKRSAIVTAATVNA